MKNIKKKVLYGGIAAATVYMGLKKSKKVIEYTPVIDKAKNGVYRMHSLVMDMGLKLPIIKEPNLIQGLGSVSQLPQILTKAGLSNVFIVTDEEVHRLLLPEILDNLTQHQISYKIYDKVEVNPSIETIDKISSTYQESGCYGILVIGGGSPMDAAKVALARSVKKKQSVRQMKGMMRILRPIPPLIAVPTTSGTGSEVSIGAIVTDHEQRYKFGILDPFLVPKYSVLDAELTKTMPPFLTATTGVDALTHAIEAYVTWAYNNNRTNRCAEEAIAKIFRYLPKSFENGDDMEAREQMLIASYKAGVAMTTAGLGYVHGIAHAIGGTYGTAHGLANSVILPIVLEDYGEAVHPQLSHLAEITGIMTDGTDAEKANAFIRAIREMNRKLGLPSGFDHIKEDDFDHIIKKVLAEVNVNYPVPVLYNAARCRHVLNRIKLEA